MEPLLLRSNEVMEWVNDYNYVCQWNVITNICLTWARFSEMAVEVWAWMSDYIQLSCDDAITYACLKL